MTVEEYKSRKALQRTWDYSLYWVTVNSEIELPEVATVSDWDSGPRVAVRLGEMPEIMRNGEPVRNWLEVLPEQCIFRIRGIASYCVEDGDRITVCPDAGADPSEVRTFLLGAAFAALLHQRGSVLLHVSAVETPEGAIAFCGPSGAGKSTMAASLYQEHGWPIVSDDAAVVRMVDGVPMIYSGVRRLRLWEDAANRLGVDVTNVERDGALRQKFLLRKWPTFTYRPSPLIRLANPRNFQPAANRPLDIASQLVSSIHRRELATTASFRKSFDTIIEIARHLVPG